MNRRSEKLWDSRAKNYNKLKGFWKNEELLVKKYFTDKSATVLDIGCGAGRTLIPLAKMGFKKVIGLDISNEMLNKVTEKVKREKLRNVKLIKSDAANMNLNDNSVDYVFNGFNSLDCVYPISKRDMALTELARIMTDGGTLIHSFHNIFTIHGRFGFWWWTPKMLLNWLLDLWGGGGYLNEHGAWIFHTRIKTERRRFEKRGFRILEELQGGIKKKFNKKFVLMAMRYR